VSVARAILGVLLGVVARVWLLTLRVTVEVHPSLRRGSEPWVFGFLHGRQWPLLAWKRPRPTAVLVSLSADGAIQSRALGMLGFNVVRGSSSRGGARGLAAIVRRLRAGEDAAFAVDGPRGPYGVVKPGIVLAARAAGGVIVPMGGAAARPKVFRGAWDRFALAWPFSRVAVVLGEPLPSRSTDALGKAIADANARAEAILAVSQGPVIRSWGFRASSWKRSRSS
jgi:lysophospholipid acyltransferase (LPLAT)-like uncharacterized protein